MDANNGTNKNNKNGNNTNNNASAVVDSVREFFFLNHEYVRHLVHLQDRFIEGLVGPSYMEEEMQRSHDLLAGSFKESVQGSFAEARVSRDLLRRRDHQRRTQEVSTTTTTTTTSTTTAVSSSPPSAAVDTASSSPPSAAANKASSVPVDSNTCRKCGKLGHHSFECQEKSVPTPKALGPSDNNAADRPSGVGEEKKRVIGPFKAIRSTPWSKNKIAQPVTAETQGAATRGTKRGIEDTNS